ncbi:uncharacterized protein LOC143023966 isoform X3 [Oratosquilla oratoria]|uniref:uncharacterized protein LOC143022498 isoform X2 n=1 Tax=Oratosquilla oratoria TaxID=337810 RepID=UPI003F766F44
MSSSWTLRRRQKRNRKVWQNLELLSLRKEMKLLWFLIPGCWMGNVIGHNTVTLQSSTELSRRVTPEGSWIQYHVRVLCKCAECSQAQAMAKKAEYS